uniref:Small ribosomal subunit protein uS5c n=1 Tax=Porphyra purpurea TaxID=2787 RepID=RR5_PORPU|nr:ribosomal protein S5 [Porphyra purpurea]P51298.1 RecName: Full=Small ribosomal subunit protein uS5c; AltName: Full=30S ribosomal protein S5, chloroplastic [Porphyra purpurea]AAC08184.1 30S ribosomal protein S5 [Porphyra purpurea]
MANRKKQGKSKEKDNGWEERVVQVKRVTKVVKGGKKLSFRVILVVGNEQGQVGVGVGKASDVIGAVKKGVTDAKKHLVTVPLTKSNSIPHPINGISGAAQVILRPSAPGSGVIAGGSVRTVLELSGVQNILAKQLGSNNTLNNARAVLNGLTQLRTFSEAAKDRGVPIENLYSK